MWRGAPSTQQIQRKCRSWHSAGVQSGSRTLTLWAADRFCFSISSSCILKLEKLRSLVTEKSRLCRKERELNTKNFNWRRMLSLFTDLKGSCNWTVCEPFSSVFLSTLFLMWSDERRLSKFPLKMRDEAFAHAELVHHLFGAKNPLPVLLSVNHVGNIIWWGRRDSNDFFSEKKWEMKIETS